MPVIHKKFFSRIAFCLSLLLYSNISVALYAATSHEIESVTASEVAQIPEFYVDEDANLVPAADASGSIQLLDTHLGQVLLLSLQRNRSIIGSAQQVKRADAQVVQSRAITGARLTGNFSHTRVDDVLRRAGVKQGQEDTQVAYFEVSQPLFLSGKDRSTLASARLGRSAAGAGHALTKQGVLAQTTMGWLAWIFAGESERVGQKDLELAEAHHALVTARFKQKQVSQFEILRAEVRLAQARSDLRKKSNSRALACLDLLQILDLPENTPISTDDRLEMIDVDIDLEKDASEAVDLREDLRIRRFEVQITKEAISGARSENQPVVSVFGQSGLQDPSPKSLTFERKGYWKAGVVANFTLNDGGMRKGKVKESHARLAIAENALQEALLQANIEIRQAYLNIETAREVVAAQSKALLQSEEALRLAGVRYKNGLFTQVELFDAENAYLGTRLQYLQAIFSYHQALTSYMFATGKIGREIMVRARK